MRTSLMDAIRLKEEGNAKLKAKNKAEAYECYSKAIQIADAAFSSFEHPHALSIDMASSYMEKLAPLQTLLSQLHSNRAHVLMLDGFLEEAFQDCQVAVSVDAENSKAYWRGTTAALQLAQVEPAAEMLREGLRSAWQTEGGPALAELLGKSCKCWEQGANAGGVASQHLLGLAYLRGNGVPKDLETGLKFLRMAAQQGDELSSEMVAQVENELKTTTKRTPTNGALAKNAAHEKPNTVEPDRTSQQQNEAPADQSSLEVMPRSGSNPIANAISLLLRRLGCLCSD